MIEPNQYIKGNSFEVLPTLPDETFDCIHSDIPYGLDMGYGKTKDVGKEATREKRFIVNDKDLNWLPPVAYEMYRVLKPDTFCIIWGKWTGIHDVKLMFEAVGFQTHTIGVWNKMVQGLGKGFAEAYENWILLAKGDAKCRYMTKNVIDFMRPQGVRPDHPHAKPKQVLKKIIDNVTKKGDLVGDFFAGSGSIAEACLELERKYYCVELDEDDKGNTMGYIDKALTKIKRYHEMQQLEFSP